MKNTMTMKRLIIPCLLFLLGNAVVCWAVKITLFSDLNTYVERGKDIVIAKCISSPPVAERTRQKGGMYSAQVEIIKVIKGAIQPGKCKVVTVHNIEPGMTYLLYSQGGSADGADFLPLPELSVVEVPPTFDLKGLDGKPTGEQVSMIFNARLSQVKKHLGELESEKKLLDKATSMK
jgi:hypothetical protein